MNDDPAWPLRANDLQLYRLFLRKVTIAAQQEGGGQVVVQIKYYGTLRDGENVRAIYILLKETYDVKYNIFTINV